jgi:hypothetical protein
MKFTNSRTSGSSRLVRGLVDVDVEEARQRVLAGEDVVGTGRVERLARLLGELDDLDPGGAVADAAVADAVAVLGDALDDRGRARLLLHGVLEVALEERVLLEEAVGARGRVAAVEARAAVAAQSPVRPRLPQV